MRVVHTYVSNPKIIQKELLYTQFLSALLAKKHYGNITFVTTPELSNLVTELGLPYDEIIIDVCSDRDFDTWTIPKLKTFSYFNEPFLHIDTDTCIFDKITFKDKFESPIVFAHPDLTIQKEKITNLVIELSKFINNIYDLNNNYDNVLHSYIELFMQLFKSYDKNLIKNIDFESIPNASIVFVNDFQLFKEATLLTLNHYTNHKTEIDSHHHGGTYIEQMMIHQHLRMLSSEYKKQSSINNHLLFKSVPFYKLTNNNGFPYDLGIINRCDHCNGGKDKIISIKDKIDITNLFDYNFEGFLHLTQNKWSDIFQAIIIDKLRKEIGDDAILKIHNYYKEINPTYILPLKSSGEILYEELTGFSFNTPKNIF